MSIVFESPGAYSPSTWSGYGALQQDMANREYELKADAAAAASQRDFGYGGGRGGGGGHIQAPGGWGVGGMSEGGGRRGGGGGGDGNDLADQYAFQLALQQGQLTQAENMRLVRLQSNLGALDEAHANGVIDDESFKDARERLITNIDPMERRRAAAQVATIQQQNKRAMDEHARIEAMRNMDAAGRQREFEKGLVTIRDGSQGWVDERGQFHQVGQSPMVIRQQAFTDAERSVTDRYGTGASRLPEAEQESVRSWITDAQGNNVRRRTHREEVRHVAEENLRFAEIAQDEHISRRFTADTPRDSLTGTQRFQMDEFDRAEQTATRLYGGRYDMTEFNRHMNEARRLFGDFATIRKMESRSPAAMRQYREHLDYIDRWTTPPPATPTPQSGQSRDAVGATETAQGIPPVYTPRPSERAPAAVSIARYQPTPATVSRVDEAIRGYADLLNPTIGEPSRDQQQIQGWRETLSRLRDVRNLLAAPSMTNAQRDHYRELYRQLDARLTARLDLPTTRAE